MATSIPGSTDYHLLDSPRVDTSQREFFDPTKISLTYSGAGFTPAMGFVAQQPPWGNQSNRPAPPPGPGQPYFEYSSCEYLDGGDVA
jgi:hypothetical protein